MQRNELIGHTLVAIGNVDWASGHDRIGATATAELWRVAPMKTTKWNGAAIETSAGTQIMR